MSRAKRYFPALLWAAFLLVVGGRSDVPTPTTDLPIDKVGHFVMYTLLGALLGWGWKRGPRRTAPLLVLIPAFALGALDELHQYTVPSRSAEVADWVADVAGSSIGFLLVVKWWGLRGHDSSEEEGTTEDVDSDYSPEAKSE